MSLHSVYWRIHCSAVDDLEIIESAMSQLSPVKTEITREKSKSYHGAPQIILAMKINNKKAAKQSLQSLGKDVLNQLVSNGLESQIDDDKIFHVRLSLSSLVNGDILLAEGSEWKSAVKGQYKIEAYPGQKPSEVLLDLISKYE
ncbi:MAG: RNA-binding domain-containing protein [Candidatus Thermoplasmatota archaeon]|nr:RNA-binding domain-containing protein [Candidatus Thermoplasmatota archaeon]